MLADFFKVISLNIKEHLRIVILSIQRVVLMVLKVLAKILRLRLNTLIMLQSQLVIQESLEPCILKKAT